MSVNLRRHQEGERRLVAASEAEAQRQAAAAAAVQGGDPLELTPQSPAGRQRTWAPQHQESWLEVNGSRSA